MTVVGVIGRTILVTLQVNSPQPVTSHTQTDNKKNNTMIRKLIIVTCIMGLLLRINVQSIPDEEKYPIKIPQIPKY